MPAKKPQTPKLHLVSDEVYRLDRKPETPNERIRRLQAEAKLLAREQVEQFERALEAAAASALQIAKGGEAYPIGVRELASRLSEDLESRALTLKALMDRTPEPEL